MARSQGRAVGRITSRTGRAPLRKSERPSTSCPRRRPMPNRTEPCGSVSTISVLSPRRANAAARLTAVVVLPPPPFWLTTARTRPGLGVSVRQRLRAARAQCFERMARVPHPSIGFGALRWLVEEQLQLLLCALHVAAFQQQDREPVVRPRQPRLEVQRPAVAPHRLVESSRLGECDRHVLEDLRVVRLVAQCEPVRRQGRVVVTLTLQRERLAQIIQALRLELALRLATNEAAPPGHESRNRVKGGPRRARRKSGVRVVGRTGPIRGRKPQSYVLAQVGATASLPLSHDARRASTGHARGLALDSRPHALPRKTCRVATLSIRTRVCSTWSGRCSASCRGRWPSGSPARTTRRSWSGSRPRASCRAPLSRQSSIASSTRSP